MGVVPAADLSAVRQWAPQAQAGDLLISRACDEATTERLLNDIRRMTHERPER